MKNQRKDYKYNSVTSIAFEIGHNNKDGSDITADQIVQVLLLRIAPLIGNSELLEATINELVDTQLTEENHYAKHN